MNINNENAFTLLEVIVSIALVSLVLGVLLNINLIGFKFWDINQENIELSQVVSIITANLDRNIRSAAVHNAENSDKDELILNLGDKGSTDKSDYYKYLVENNRLVLKKPATSGFSLNNDLPDGVSWVKERNITDEIIKEDSLTVKLDNNTVKYSIVLMNENKEFSLENKIKPRR